MLVGLDKKCNCRNKIIAKKCCMKIEHETATKRGKMLTNTSCNLQRNFETTKTKNVSRTRHKMQM